MTKGIVIGFFCFVLFLSHIVIFRKFDIKRRFFGMLNLFFLGLAVYATLFIFISPEVINKFIISFVPVWLFAFLSGTFLHFSIFYLYLYFIQVIDRSPATRIMVDIQNNHDRKMTREELEDSYSFNQKVADELEDMVVLGRLNKEGAFYGLTAKGKTHMLIFKTIRDYLGLRRS